MPRLNVEESLWSDPRFLKLCIILGDPEKAVGHVVMAWRLAQKFWCPNKKPIPSESWNLGRYLIESGLVTEGPEGFYVAGSEEQFAWWFKRQAAGRMGGLASAKTRASKGQRLLNVGEANESKSNPLPLPLKTNTKTITSAVADKTTLIERIVASYPKRGPGQAIGKTHAVKKLMRLSLTDLEKFDRAVGNYAKQCSADGITGTEFVKMLSSFASPNVWPDWVERKSSNAQLTSTDAALKALKIANGEEVGVE